MKRSLKTLANFDFEPQNSKEYHVKANLKKSHNWSPNWFATMMKNVYKGLIARPYSLSNHAIIFDKKHFKYVA